MIQEFFDKRENRKLVFLVDAKDQLVPETEFPRALKKKAVYFFKPEEMQVTKENVKNLIRGDLSSTPIELLSALVDGVFLPLLSSTANNGGWPKVVSEDVVLHAQELKSSTHVVMGQVKGQTLLPMPVGSEELESGQDTVVSKAMVHAIESAVIEWAHQVRDVLKKDSAQPLIEGLNPGALVELDFWTAKKANLTCISEQLNSPQMLHMRRILEDHNSSYAPALQKLYRDVQEAFDESVDITKHLAPLRSFLEDIEEGEFSNFPIVFMQLLKILSLVWKHSKHYCTPRHAVVILREIFNQLIGSVRPCACACACVSACDLSPSSLPSFSLSLSLSLFLVSLSLSFFLSLFLSFFSNCG
jgi:dynein heavy chain, axonemal